MSRSLSHFTFRPGQFFHKVDIYGSFHLFLQNDFFLLPSIFFLRCCFDPVNVSKGLFRNPLLFASKFCSIQRFDQDCFDLNLSLAVMASPLSSPTFQSLFMLTFQACPIHVIPPNQWIFLFSLHPNRLFSGSLQN